MLILPQYWPILAALFLLTVNPTQAAFRRRKTPGHSIFQKAVPKRKATPKPKAAKELSDLASITPPWRVCPNGQEGALVPVQKSADVILVPPKFTKDDYVKLCVEPYGQSCAYPGSFVAFKDSCSLQCQCLNAQKTLSIIASDFSYTNCHSICARPPIGLRCFSQRENGNCCPTYKNCVRIPKSFMGDWSDDGAAYQSRSFRCTKNDTLDAASCLLLIKEALPEEDLTPKTRGLCSCIADDTFQLTSFSAEMKAQPNAGKEKFALIKTEGQVKQELL